MARRRQPRIDSDIQAFIDEFALKGWGPSHIYEELSQQKQFKGRTLPRVRTVQRRVKDLTPRDPTGPWRWWEDDPDDARLALDVLAEVIVRTEGRVTQFMQREADWISRLRRMLPEVSLWEIYMLARGYYMLREDEGPQHLAPEDFLLFTAWRSEEHERRWLRVLEMRQDGKVPPERPWAIKLPIRSAGKEDTNVRQASEQ